MADSLNMSCTIEHLDLEEAPNGPGFYYSLVANPDAIKGPFGSEDEAAEDFTDTVKVVYANLLKESLGLS